MRLFDSLKDPRGFFESVKEENWKPGFIFFVGVTIFLAVFTPIVNFLDIESTDFSSAYQAQILAYRFMQDYLLEPFGIFAYIIEAFLIVVFAIIILLLYTAFLHMLYRLLGGKGSILNAWKAVCYGAGPCVFGGFLPIISLFAAFYSFLFQLYIGPMVLYEVKESRAIVLLAIFIALTFIEMFVVGTTVGFS
ncbi:MAG: YIP1 family protein [Candidatus Hermodarchaeota archaeon]